MPGRAKYIGSPRTSQLLPAAPGHPHPMTDLTEHESFLRAIFDGPDDDTPRLVYADFLEEHGDPDLAAFIRLGCERARLREGTADGPGWPDRNADLVQLLDRHAPEWPWCGKPTDRGFPIPGRIALRATDLAEPDALRATVVQESPEWYGATALGIAPGEFLLTEHIEPLFALPFTQQVHEWDLSGHVEELAAGPETAEAGTFALIDMNVEPVISIAAVKALASQRGARRIQVLNLTHNNLDNDAARALAESQYFIRLERLDLLEGNRLRGRTWQQLRAKFGEDVVG